MLIQPSSKFPRAIAGLRVRAENDPLKLIGQIQAAVTDMKTKQNERLSSLESHQNSLAVKIAAAQLGGAPGAAFQPDDPEYSTAFASYFRKGDTADEQIIRHANASGRRAQINAAMNVGTNDSGGYLAPTEWDRRINQALVAKSPIRRLATVQTTSVNAFTSLWSTNSWGSGWVGETAARPETGTPTLSPIPYAHGEIYANPSITQRLLDDADMNLEEWLAGQVETEFARQEAIAFLGGNGTNKPFGLLQYVTGGAAAAQHPGGVLDVVNSGHATTIPNTDILIDFFYGLTAPYRQNSTWLMNSTTAAALSKFKDGDGNYIWRAGLIVGQPDALLGRPVEIDEGMPSIGAGNLAVAFGDFKAGYLINDRFGTRVLRDPYTNKPYVSFYTTKRVGGGVSDPKAIRLLKVSAA